MLRSCGKQLREAGRIRRSKARQSTWRWRSGGRQPQFSGRQSCLAGERDSALQHRLHTCQDRRFPGARQHSNPGIGRDRNFCIRPRRHDQDGRNISRGWSIIGRTAGYILKAPVTSATCFWRRVGDSPAFLLSKTVKSIEVTLSYCRGRRT